MHTMMLFGGRPASQRRRMWELVCAMSTASSSSCAPLEALPRVDGGSLSSGPVAPSVTAFRLYSAEIVFVSTLTVLAGDGSR